MYCNNATSLMLKILTNVLKIILDFPLTIQTVYAV